MQPVSTRNLYSKGATFLKSYPFDGGSQKCKATPNLILLFSGNFPFNQDVLPEKYVIFLGLAFGLSAESNLPLIFFFFLNCSFEGKSGLYCFTVCCSATHANGHPSKAHYISNMLYNNYGTKMLLNEKVTVF